MRVPLSWLAEYVPLEMPLDELATRLSIASAEIEGIEMRGVADADGNLDLFRVGRVLEAEKHPNADRLQLTKVDIGDGDVSVRSSTSSVKKSELWCERAGCQAGKLRPSKL